MTRLYFVFTCLYLMSLSSAIVPVDDFFPFGTSQSDTAVPTNDDGSSPAVPISTLFPFFNRQHNNLTVNTNGVISFLRPVSQYTPDPFPLGGDRRLVAAFWADVDTNEGGKIWYRESTEESLLTRVTDEILTHASALRIRSLSNFRATWIFVATWDNVAFFGSSVAGRHLRNTFQIVLATNGRHSFAIFNYNNIQWTTGRGTESGGHGDTGRGGTPAQVGFNAGDGINYFAVNSSRTDDIININMETNVGVPGKIIFRIDDADIQAGGCNTGGGLTITPNFGNMLGGHDIYVSGPCFERDPDVNVGNQVVAKLKFDSSKRGQVEVECNYEDEYTARCVAPLNLFRTGRLNVSLQVHNQEGTNETFYGFYSPENILLHPPKVRRLSPLSWRDANKLIIAWKPSGVIESLNCSNNFGRLDLLVYKETKAGPAWKYGTELSPLIDISSGIHTLSRPSYTTEWNEQVGVLRMSCGRSDGIKLASRAVWSDVHSLHWTSGKLGRTTEAKQWCEAWINREMEMGSYDNGLGDCPCTIDNAAIDVGKFHRDPHCNLGLKHCQEIRGADECFYSNSPGLSGAGQRCCYDKEGELLRGTWAFFTRHYLKIGKSRGDMVFDVQTKVASTLSSRVAGRSSRYHYMGNPPYGENGKVPYLSTFLGDEIPYQYCCVYNNGSSRHQKQCDTYMSLRPGSDCKNYEPPRPAVAAGDPHLVTLDGLSYTFNGMGEYVLLETATFILQGRTEQAKDTQGNLRQASVFTAIVAKGNTTDTAQVQLNEIAMAEVLVNGVKQNFDDRAWQDFEGVSILVRNNTKITLMFHQEKVAIRIDATPDVMNLMVLGDDDMKGSTRGLLGNWTGDTADDLVMSNGTIVPSNASSADIHAFGESWATSEATSLFTYRTGKTHASYRNEMFIPVFLDEILKETNITTEQRQVCGDDEMCLFDFITTNNSAIAESTRNIDVVYVEVVATAQKVVRCSYLSSMQHGTRNITGYKPGDTATYQCEDGYAVTGVKVLECSPEGAWSSQPPVCSKEPEVEADSEDPKGIGIVLIGVIAGSGVLLVVLIVVAVVVIRRKLKNKGRRQADTNTFETDNPTYSMY